MGRKKSSQPSLKTKISDEEFDAIENRRREYFRLTKLPIPAKMSEKDKAFILEKRVSGSSEVKFYSEERLNKLRKLLDAKITKKH